MSDEPRQYLAEIKGALDTYRALGWCALPADATRKCPAVPWREYQLRRPTVGEALELFRRAWRRLTDNLGIGIVTGQVSGLLVLDLDASKNCQPAGWESLADQLKEMPPCPTVCTPSGGRHYYFQLPPGNIPPRNASGRLPGVDWRGEGGWIVAPPTRGGEYAWAPGCGPGVPLPPCPDWLLTLIQEESGPAGAAPRRKAHDWEAVVPALRQEGQRNDACAKLSGWFARHKFPEEAAAMLLQAASTLPPDEVAATVHSIYSGHQRRHPPTPSTPQEVLEALRAGQITRPGAALQLVEMGFDGAEIRILLKVKGGTDNAEN